MAERRIDRAMQNLLLAISIILNLIHLASAAVITTPSSSSSQDLTPSFQNLTQSSQNDISNNNYCTTSQSWVGSGSFTMDCIHAVVYLYDTEVKSRITPQADASKEDFEFVTPRVPPSSKNWMKTPRKYTVGTCTVAVIMLNFFQKDPRQQMPEIPGKWHASRDMASFYEIWQAANQLERVCLLHNGQPGWASEGGRGAIGVFMWGTDSDENRRVPQGEKIPALPSSQTLALPSNGTDGGQHFAIS
ncbi:hypothetical protein ACLMJK_003295 [Lecanora helva]